MNLGKQEISIKFILYRKIALGEKPISTTCSRTKIIFREKASRLCYTRSYARCVQQVEPVVQQACCYHQYFNVCHVLVMQVSHQRNPSATL